MHLYRKTGMRAKCPGSDRKLWLKLGCVSGSGRNRPSGMDLLASMRHTRRHASRASSWICRSEGHVSRGLRHVRGHCRGLADEGLQLGSSRWFADEGSHMRVCRRLADEGLRMDYR